MQQFLLTLAREAELDLAGYGGWYGMMSDAPLEYIAAAIANAPRDITFVSLGGHVRDIQYDQPGSMNPSQQAALSFIPASMVGDECDSANYIRRHAARVVIVTGERLPTAPPTSAAKPEARSAGELTGFLRVLLS